MADQLHDRKETMDLEQEIDDLLEQFPAFTIDVCKEMLEKGATEEELEERHEKEEEKIDQLKEKYPALTTNLCKELLKNGASEIQLTQSNAEEEQKIKKLQEEFPALSIDICKEERERGASKAQLQRRNKNEKKKAVERVTAFIPNMDTSSSTHKVLNIVLLGKTGVGKSKTGNLIIGKDDFIASSSAKSCTQTINGKECVINGVTVRVVDTPGFIDTEKDEEAIATELLKVGLHFEEGIHAFIFVRDLGNPRYTAADKIAFKSFKETFSDEVVSYCVFLFTKADEVLNMEDLNVKTIEEWTKKNLTGDDIYGSVGDRVLAVENVKATPFEKAMQRARLVSFIQSRLPYPHPYYLDVFKEAKAEYEKGLNQMGITLDRAGRNVVNVHLHSKTRFELAKIAIGQGTFLKEVETLSEKSSVKGHVEEVGKLLKLSAGILVKKTIIGRLIRYAVSLFRFALR